MQRFLGVVIVILLVAGGVGYLWIEHSHHAELASVRASATASVEAARGEAATAVQELAEDLARALAVAVTPAVAEGDAAGLEAVAAAAVQGHRIGAFLVLATDGSVLATSDLRFRGRRLDEPWARAAMAAEEPAVLDQPAVPGQLQVAAPVVAGGGRVGTLVLRIDVRRPQAS